MPYFRIQECDEFPDHTGACNLPSEMSGGTTPGESADGCSGCGQGLNRRPESLCYGCLPLPGRAVVAGCSVRNRCIGRSTR